MADFPDVYCWIKLVEKSTGKAVPTGTQFWGSADVIVRYVVANDSHEAAGPFWVVGSLFKNGVEVRPAGKPVVPSQVITLQPNQVWKAEYQVKDSATLSDTFEVSMQGDVGNWVKDEEDEKNNKAKAKFIVAANP